MPTGVPFPTPSAFRPFAARTTSSSSCCVGDRRALADRLALVVVRDPVAEPRLDVAVEAVVRDVDLPAAVPLRVRELPLEQRRERLEPGHALATLPLPELLERDVVDVRPSRSPAPRTPGGRRDSGAPPRGASRSPGRSSAADPNAVGRVLRGGRGPSRAPGAPRRDLGSRSRGAACSAWDQRVTMPPRRASRARRGAGDARSDRAREVHRRRDRRACSSGCARSRSRSTTTRTTRASSASPAATGRSSAAFRRSSAPR